ncbi:hypothetical protein ScPMuIL_000675 [Solemya velum]
MDECIHQLLAEMKTPEPLQGVIHNILDEPIPRAIKRRLLKSLLPDAAHSIRPSPQPRTSTTENKLLYHLGFPSFLDYIKPGRLLESERRV